MNTNFVFLSNTNIVQIFGNIDIPILKKFREEWRIWELKCEEFQKKVEKHCPRAYEKKIRAYEKKGHTRAYEMNFHSKI